jgi:hypothetical protein
MMFDVIVWAISVMSMEGDGIEDHDVSNDLPTLRNKFHQYRLRSKTRAKLLH